MAAIYFDLDGTLLRFNRRYDRIFALACERVGVDAPDGAYDTYTAAFVEAFEGLHDDPYREGARVAIHEHDLETGAGALSRTILAVERESVSPPKGARDALETFAETHRLGVLSNGVGDVQREKLAHHGLADYFDAVLVSHELGVMKPDPEIFAIARRKFDADTYVYVADDAEDDLLPASEMGFRTVHVADDIDPDDSSGDLVIRPEEFDRIPEVL